MDKKDRTRLSSEYDFGEVIGTDSLFLDEPVYAKIDFDNLGNIISEDYTNLIEQLEKVIIPKEIKVKKTRPNYKGEETFSSIQLHRLLSYGLSEIEMAFAIEYLESRNIRVAGISGSLSEDSNYDYYRTYHNTILPKPLDKEELQALCIDYYETKNPLSREKIIMHSLRLVPYTAYKAALYYKVDQEELESYGYEELLHLVDKFNPYKGASFSTYAIASLNYKYRRNILDIKSDNPIHVSQIVERAILVVEEYNEKPIDNNPDLEEDVIELSRVMSDYRLSEKAIRNYINIRDTKRFTSPDEKGDMSFDVTNDYDLAREAYKNHIAADVREALEILTERERKVIELRFGFYDGRERTLEEVGNVFGVGKERIRQIEAKALRKLRRPSIARQFDEVWDIYEANPQPYIYSSSVKGVDFVEDENDDDHDFEYHLFDEEEETPSRRVS